MLTVLAITVLRIIMPLTIFRWPLAGFLIAIVCDGLDWYLLPHVSSSDIAFYNKWDKFFDIYFITIALTTLLHWKDLLVRKVAIWLYAYRLIGVFLFEVTGLRLLMFIFPNIFDFYFVLIRAHKKFINHTKIFNTINNLVITLLLLAIVKLTQEYFIHVNQKMPWQYIPLPFLDQAGKIESIGNILFWFVGSLLVLVSIFVIKILLDREPEGISQGAISLKS